MYCDNCGNGMDDSAKFCQNCGDPVSKMEALSKTDLSSEHYKSTEQREIEYEASENRTGMTTIKKTYHNCSDKFEHAAEAVNRLLINEKLEIQRFNDENEVIIQAKQKNKNKMLKFVKKAAGMEMAATVTLNRIDNDVKVSIGAAKWQDKAAGAAVAWFLFWPAILTTGFGLYMQKKLFTKIDRKLFDILG